MIDKQEANDTIIDGYDLDDCWDLVVDICDQIASLANDRWSIYHFVDNSWKLTVFSTIAGGYPMNYWTIFFLL